MVRDFVSIDGARMSYLRTDDVRGVPLVFVHGTPSNAAEFERVGDLLAPHASVIAIDALGFGASDKPVNADYSIDAHASRWLRALDALGIDRLHVISADFGTAIAVRALLPHWQRVESLTLMNTWLWPLRQTEPAMEKQRWVMTSAMMRALYRHLDLSARVLAPAAWGTFRPMTDAQRNRFRVQFARASDREATVAFLCALFDEGEPAWALAPALAEQVTRLATRVQMLWGGADRLVSQRTLDRWRTLLPNALVTTWPTVGHFVADEAPELVAAAILAARSA